MPGPLSYLLLLISATFHHVDASPLLQDRIDTIKHLLGRDVFEWTAFGDSYASGVGAEPYISESYRCLRYGEAYPSTINTDSRLPPGDHVFHYAACSGSSTADVEAYQFFDQDEFGKPNWQFGLRPKFGEPSMGTLSLGGNDIDFPGIIFNCILDYNLPRFTGTPARSCDEQRDDTRKLLADPDTVTKLYTTMKKIVDRAQQGPIGTKFKLYVVGYPQFFDTSTNECDSVTFARTANPKPDGKDHPMMTQAVRKDFNDMSVHLNEIVALAASKLSDRGVKFIPIDQIMGTHRFCEPGIKEPDQKNDNLWLYHYPYNEPDQQDFVDAFRKAADNATAGVQIADKFPSYVAYQNAVFDNVQFPGDPKDTGWQDPGWNWTGKRVKVFHPQAPLHNEIRNLVLDQYIQDLGGNGNNASQPPPQAKDDNKCHGISGNYWVMSRDVAVANAKDFCGQTQNNKTYNAGSVNELSLSVRDPNDTSKGPKDAPDCAARFTNVVIDGCDGSDSINNPHNYKFGSTFTSADGWEYQMTPLHQQVDEDTCSASYQFWDDFIEIRGKDFPDAKLGDFGQHLLEHMRHCGAVTDWQFQYTPDDVKYQWYASGKIIVGQRDCVGQALIDSGGANNGGCYGNS